MVRGIWSIFDTLLARLLLASLLGITVFHLLSLWSYEHALEQQLTNAHESRLAERLVSIKRSLMLVSRGEREALAHDLSSGPVEAHWNEARGAKPGGPGVENWRGLTERVRLLAGDLDVDDVVIGTSTDPHVALLSIQLPDSSWLNVNIFAASRFGSSVHESTLISTSLMAAGVVILSFVLSTWITRPIRRIAAVVVALSPDDTTTPVPETGPPEVRHLAAAFNDLRKRIADMVVRRTRSLAAVSHDLRTPLTRLKLRLDDVGDPALQAAMARDIEEMEQMIDSTLAYLKGGASTEHERSVDLVAITETLVDDARDQGHAAEFVGPQTLVVSVRPVSMKRALSNLINNALRFGSDVRVSIEVTDTVRIIVDDDGPGIPPDKLHTVLEPFVRLEDSRNSETGGVGLGLTIAKANVEANDGTLTLSNRPEGGLRAEISLPVRRADLQGRKPGRGREHRPPQLP